MTGKQFSLPYAVIGDSRLGAWDRLVLIGLFSECREDRKFSKQLNITVDRYRLSELPRNLDIDRDQFRDSLKKLKKLGWIRELKQQGSGKVTYTLVIPEPEKEKGTGQQVAQSWSDYFGTRQLTPTIFSRIKSYLEDGMEEEVILKAMELSKERAGGNPINYLFSILNDYISRGIMTPEEFEQEKQRVESYERELQKNNRKKEAATQRETLEDLYKKGYE